SVATLLVGLVLAQRIDGPDCRRPAADQGDLQDKADDAGDRAPDGEEHHEGQNDREDEPHENLLWGIAFIWSAGLGTQGEPLPAVFRLDSGPEPCDVAAMKRDMKICGLKGEEAVRAAVDGGATHIGFIFFPKSPR